MREGIERKGLITVMETIGIEVGNSNVKIGLFYKERLVKVITFPTKDIECFKIPAFWNNRKPVLIGIASVVPQINTLLKEKFSIYKKKVFFITPSLCGIPLKIKNPDRVGVDRVLNCKAAIEFFNSDVVVIDIGTAITMDYASRKGFFGGVIIPGPFLWKGALTSTALIKDIKEVRAKIPGKDTSEAICSGIRYGIPGAINSIVSVYKKRYPSVKVVLTGGGSKEFNKGIEFDIMRKYLGLEGLGMVLYGMYGKTRRM
ncbi:MAG: type III pantothenate kinase [bacterium]|nr:type III pantothenate kinase [bacterium]